MESIMLEAILFTGSICLYSYVSNKMDGKDDVEYRRQQRRKHEHKGKKK